jgi:tRNA(Arg) A34 adenosine deaminase TadA
MPVDVSAKFLGSAVLKRAFEEAASSNYTRHPVGCVIFKGKNIAVSSHNSVRASRKVPKRFKEFEESLHAEASAIIKAKRNLTGYSILVIRVRNGKLMNSKPCEMCQGFLDHVGIRRIFYSTNEGTIVEEI